MRPITSWFLERLVSGRAGLADSGRTTPHPSPRLPSPSLLHCPEQGVTSGRRAWPVSHVLHSKDGESHFTHNYGQRMQQGSAKNSWKEPTHTHTHTPHTHTQAATSVPHTHVLILRWSLSPLNFHHCTMFDGIKLMSQRILTPRMGRTEAGNTSPLPVFVPGLFVFPS